MGAKKTVRKDGRPHKTTTSATDKAIRAKKDAFLATYSTVGVISVAARAAGIERATHYRWLELDEEYRERFRLADEQAGDVLEAEMVRRAVHGVEEPVFYQGVECGTVRKYSDTLLIFALKGKRPEKFRDHYDVNHHGKVGIDGLGDLLSLAFASGSSA